MSFHDTIRSKNIQERMQKCLPERKEKIRPARVFLFTVISIVILHLVFGGVYTDVLEEVVRGPKPPPKPKAKRKRRPKAPVNPNSTMNATNASLTIDEPPTPIPPTPIPPTPIPPTPIPEPPRSFSTVSDLVAHFPVQMAKLARFSDVGGTRAYLTDRHPNSSEVGRVSQHRCTNNTNCRFEENCVADMEGRCYEFTEDLDGGFKYRPQLGKARVRPTGGTQNVELRCSWQTNNPDPLPPLDLEATTPEGKFDTFKHLTGSYIGKWYDISNNKIKKVVPQQHQGGNDSTGTPPSNFQYRAGHDGNGAVFQMKNVCVRPSGRLAAYNVSGLQGWPKFKKECERVKVNCTDCQSDCTSGCTTDCTANCTTECTPPSSSSSFSPGSSLNPFDDDDELAAGATGPVDPIADECVSTCRSNCSGGCTSNCSADCTCTTALHCRDVPNPLPPPNRIPTYHGGHDVYPFLGPSSSESTAYLAAINTFVTTIEELNEEPTWYVDQKLAIQPAIDSRDTHAGHALMRVGALINNIEDTWPRPSSTPESQLDEGRNDVTTMVVRLPYLFESSFLYAPPEMVYSQTGYWRFTTLATRSHFYAYAHNQNVSTAHFTVPVWKEKTAAGRQFVQETKNAPLSMKEQLDALLEEALDRPVCFREALVYQSCFNDDCLAEPGRYPAWPLFGFKTPSSQQRVARRFRSCAAVEHLARKAGKPHAPRIVFGQRSRTKGIQHANTLTPLLFQWIEKRMPKAELILFEIGDKPPYELAAFYSTVDIIIAPYGSDFLYSFCMPHAETSIGVELSYFGITLSPHVGTDRNYRTDYGSAFRALGGRHITVVLNPHAGRHPTKRFVMPFDLMHKALKSALCYYTLLQQGLSERVQVEEFVHANQEDANAGLVNARNALCELSPHQVAPAELAWEQDTQGLDLRRNVRANFPEWLVPWSPRLRTIHANSADIATRLIRHRSLGLVEIGPLLLVFKCQNNNPYFRQTVSTELKFWREHLNRRTHIHFLLDNSTCPRLGNVETLLDGFRDSALNALPDAGRMVDCGAWNTGIMETCRNGTTYEDVWTEQSLILEIEGFGQWLMYSIAPGAVQDGTRINLFDDQQLGWAMEDRGTRGSRPEMYLSHRVGRLARKETPDNPMEKQRKSL